MRVPPEFEPTWPAWRFHARGPDDLIQPIAFVFVTERMCAEILAEREEILRATPPLRRLEQCRLFSQYDPQRRAELFQSLLRPFVAEPGEAEAA